MVQLACRVAVLSARVQNNRKDRLCAIPSRSASTKPSAIISGAGWSGQIGLMRPAYAIVVIASSRK
jgi:hypothetical protein